jgi:hypothetical protein
VGHKEFGNLLIRDYTSLPHFQVIPWRYLFYWPTSFIRENLCLDLRVGTFAFFFCSTSKLQEVWPQVSWLVSSGWYLCEQAGQGAVWGMIFSACPCLSSDWARKGNPSFLGCIYLG